MCCQQLKPFLKINSVIFLTKQDSAHSVPLSTWDFFILKQQTEEPNKQELRTQK